MGKFEINKRYSKLIAEESAMYDGDIKEWYGQDTYLGDLQERISAHLINYSEEMRKVEKKQGGE